MNGISDVLADKLVELGISKLSLGSSIIPAMLTIFADVDNAPDAFEEIRQIKNYHKEATAEANRKEREYSELIRRIRNEKYELDKLKDEMKSKMVALECARQSIDMEKEEFYKIKTKSSREKVRLAEWYKRNVKIDSCYDNTKFIEGLGRILSGTYSEDETEEE